MVSKIVVFIISSVIICSKIADANYEEPWMELNTFASDLWSEGMDVVRILWKDCSMRLANKNNTNIKQEHFATLMKCAKRKTLRALDRTLGSDVISLGPGIQLVKYEKVGKDGKITKQPNRQGNETARATLDTEFEKVDWKYAVLNRMANVFKTHVLKLDMSDNIEIEQGRHRRRHHMMQMMMFGITSMGMILVPMGFQFLAVLGGKALLLAKLALILSSIQGLKKIATSPINYGLYHTYPPFESHIEKRGYGNQDWPKPKTNKPEEWTAEEAGRSDGHEKIQYKYDSASRLWKPEPGKVSKRSYANLINTAVYPVYPVSPHEVNPTSFSSPDFAYSPAASPTEIHAEYTIDLPVNKVQFKSSSPLISS